MILINLQLLYANALFHLLTEIHVKYLSNSEIARY